jgi:Calx-beta domain
MPTKPRLACAAIAVIAAAGAVAFPASDASAAVVVRSATGTPAEIQATVDAFRADLGALNVNVPGSRPAGRREVNWDGVPPAFSDPNAFPADFFNTTSPRGVLVTSPGTGQLVSGTPARFGAIDATYPTAFGTFSPPKVFAPLGATRTDLAFRVPGDGSATATSAGVGIVLTDVDRNGPSALELFDAQGVGLGRFAFAAAPGNAQLSFVGVLLTGGERAARAVIDAGDTPLGPDDVTQGGAADVAAMDDVVYGEPQPVGAVSATAPAPVAETAGAATVVVTRSQTSGAGSVAFATGGGTATAGADYVPVSGRLHFADGEGSKAVEVPLVTDLGAEPTETIGFTLSAPHGTLRLAAADLSITVTDLALKGAPPQLVTAPAVPDTTKPRVTVLRSVRGATTRSQLARGVAAVVGSSEDGRLTVRVRTGKRVLLTRPARAIRAGATAVTAKLGRGARKRLSRSARSVVLEAIVTDAAGNTGRAARTIALRR